MRQNLEWKVSRLPERNSAPQFIAARVPGTAQLDYAEANHFPDYRYSDNYKKFDGLEDSYWLYRAPLPKNKSGMRSVFFCGGIDYEFEIFAGKEMVLHQEGMFTPVRLDLTDYIADGAKNIDVLIYPAPKRKGAPVGRWEADNCCKPPVSYGWDWHPRLITQGIWKDTYIEYLPSSNIERFEVSYELSDDFDRVEITAETVVSDGGRYTVTLYDRAGKAVAKADGEDKLLRLSLESPNLWWPVRQGEQYLYRIEAVTESGHAVSKKLGFRRSRLVPQDYNWWITAFPFTQALPPITLEINGRQIFAKGSNFVNPDIFIGRIDRNTYEPLVRIARDANMNIFRVWGGAIVNKDSFFDLCDEYGIMVWQEFPLACNCYRDDPHYLSVMEQEAASIIESVRPHPCHVLWCGGNELFTGGSSMTEQFLVLRLLNSLCFKLDKFTPYINTSPIMGMRHGHYIFKFSDGHECIDAFQRLPATAFTEFGCPAPNDIEYIRSFIPEEELSLDNMGKSWVAHHGLESWVEDSWVCRSVIEEYFGVSKSLEQLIERGKVLSRAGYKAMFEEARRQKPNCQMVINWCFNEPWPCAANNSLVSYPAVERDNLQSVRESLKDVVLSARVQRFSYREGDTFSAELFVHNDTNEEIKALSVKAYLTFAGTKTLILRHCFSGIGANANKKGPIAQYVLPHFEKSGLMKLELVCEENDSFNNSYEFLYYNADTVQKMESKQIVMDFVGISDKIGDYTGLDLD